MFLHLSALNSMSVHPLEEIPLLLLYLRFLPLFPSNDFCTCVCVCEVFPHPNQGAKDDGCHMLYRL